MGSELELGGYRPYHTRGCLARVNRSSDQCSCGGLQQPEWEPGDEPRVNLEPAAEVPPDREQSPPLAGNVGGRPDFVMVGMSRPGGGVILFASLTLTEAELHKELRGVKRVPLTPNPRGPVAKLRDERISVTAEMHDYTQIIADDYPSAMQTLQEQWSRKQPQPGRTLPPGI